LMDNDSTPKHIFISNKWIIEEILYNKGNRQIWKCSKKGSKDKDFVMKIHYPFNQTDIFNFEKEIELQKYSSSNYVLSIIDYKSEPIIFDNKHIQYIISPYYKINLANNNNEFCDPLSALQFFLKLLNGVQYLKNKRIIHRDLKPENLMLDKNKSPIICDFGQAINIKNRFKFGYILKKEDIYNLAKILYFLLTNIRLFKFGIINQSTKKLDPVSNCKDYHVCGFNGLGILHRLMLDMTQKKIRKRPSLEDIKIKIDDILLSNNSFDKTKCRCQIRE